MGRGQWPTTSFVKTCKTRRYFFPGSPSAASTFAVLHRFLGSRARKALRRVASGELDQGSLRDLIDAAMFGDGPAAFAIARITLSSKNSDTSRKQVESIAWLEVSALNGMGQGIKAELLQLREQAGPSVCQQADELFEKLKVKISRTRNNPWEIVSE
jgi:hypothetical protein